jgi:DeoR/GlpR family transcriptional regulator of sugar metabolism
MRVPLHVIETRRAKLAALLERHRYLPVAEVCRLLDVSEATARRDLAALASQSRVIRTHGGALMEFNERFPSFHDRRGVGTSAKERIGQAAARLLQPGGTYFLDSGTTLYALAEAFRENPVGPLTIVTSNLPAGEILSQVPEISVYLTGGQILARQSVLLGEAARRSLEFWTFDAALMSAEAINAEGIWNSQETIVSQQKVAIRRSGRVVYCLDAGKIGATAPFLLVSWGEVDRILSNATGADLARAGLQEQAGRFFPADPTLPPLDLSPAEKTSLPVHFL